MNRRTLLLGTGVVAAMGVSAKALAMDAPLPILPMKAADIDPAFEKAFNAGDLDALLKLYDEQSVLVAEPGKPVKGLENIKQALTGFLADPTNRAPRLRKRRHRFLHGRLEHCRQGTRWEGCQSRRDIGGGGQENLERQRGICDR
jgi:hypothetical protein